MAHRKPTQLTLEKHSGWGGKRARSGRKPIDKKAMVSHAKRPLLTRRSPVHVTLRVLPHVWNLRSKRSFAVLRKAMSEGGNRLGLRLCDFSIQGNHLHLVVEADDSQSLSRGMQGLAIRAALGLNRLMGRHGRVMCDRFHSRLLRTPTEVRHALHYVRGNHDVHRRRWGQVAVEQPDEFSSTASDHNVTLADPKSFLLKRAHHEFGPPAS